MPSITDQQALHDLWKESLKGSHKVQSYPPTVQRLVNYMDANAISLTSLSQRDIEKFIVQNYRQINKSSANVAIRQWLDFGVDNGWVKVNVAANLPPAKHLVGPDRPYVRGPYKKRAESAENAEIRQELIAIRALLDRGFKAVDVRFNSLRPARPLIPSTAPTPAKPNIYERYIATLKTDSEKALARVLLAKFAANVAPEKASLAEVQHFMQTYKAKATLQEVEMAYDILLGFFETLENNPLKSYNRADLPKFLWASG